VVVVANHPFGALEGVVLAELLTRVRPDVKVMANYLLGRIPELRELFFFVDPFGGRRRRGTTWGAAASSVKWVEGAAAGDVPAGEVSSLDLKRREVTGPAWTPWSADRAGRGRAAVPVFFGGRTARCSSWRGWCTRGCGRRLLARQVMNKRDRAIDVRIGSVIPGRQLKAIAGTRR